MKLILVRTSSEMLIGKSTRLYSELIDNRTLEIPMAVIQQQITQPSKINGGAPQILTGFRLVPIPCRKIFLSDISYWGEVDSHDSIAEMYTKIEEAMKEAQKSPLLVAQ